MTEKIDNLSIAVAELRIPVDEVHERVTVKELIAQINEVVTEDIQTTTDNSLSITSSSSTTSTSSSHSDSQPPPVPEKEDPSILVSRLLHELQLSRQENRRLSHEIATERTARLELQSAKNALTAEIEELTKTLFEEANGMVASEAQARWTLQQSHTRLEHELQKTRELLNLEAEQTKLLRAIVEEEKSAKKSNDPVLWDVDVFASRLSDSYYDDFFQERTFDSRSRSVAIHWESLSTRTLDTHQFQTFSNFIDECFRVSVKTRDALLSDDSIVTVLGHQFMRSCLQADIEPCLAFPVLERNGKTKSLLKKLLPAMLKNTCVIEPLSSPPSSSKASPSILSPESIRASPLSIRSFISITAPPRSKTGSPIKTSTNAINIPTPFTSDLMVAGSPASITSIESCPVSPISTAKCSMCDASGKDSHFLVPTHRFRICTSNSSPVKQPQWNLICKSCRNRLVSVASFFTILRHLLQGLHAHRPKLDVYFDFMHAKRYMFYTRSGVDPSFYALSDFEAFSKKISE